MDKVAAGAQSQWFGEWSGDIFSAVTSAANTVASSGSVPVFVAYNIPQRDCGGLSGGNNVVASQYKTWINGFASGIGADSTSPATERLRDILGNLNVPPLEPVPADHVLTKSFFILPEFPGRFTGSPLVLE